MLICLQASSRHTACKLRASSRDTGYLNSSCVLQYEQLSVISGHSIVQCFVDSDDYWLQHSATLFRNRYLDNRITSIIWSHLTDQLHVAMCAAATKPCVCGLEPEHNTFTTPCTFSPCQPCLKQTLFLNDFWAGTVNPGLHGIQEGPQTINYNGNANIFV